MSECGVCLTADDSCYTEFLKTRIRTARKIHECCECNGSIPVGQKYEYAWGKTEGELWDCKTCLVCAEIANAFYCDGRMYGGELWEQMNDYAFEQMNTGCLTKLQTAAAKAELVRRWKEWKFES